MSPRNNSSHTIRKVLSEFAESRQSILAPREFYAYRRVLFFLELCINNYGHRNLNASERALCEKHHHAAGEAQRHFFDLFGPEKLLYELDFFANVYVKRNVFTSERIENKAPEVVEALRQWLVQSRYVTQAEVDAATERRLRQTKLRTRTRQAARLLAERTVAVDPNFFAETDYIDTDDHPIVRVDPGRVWLRVFRTAEPEDIGPLAAPLAATKNLRVGWSVSCALARVQGRWRMVTVDGVYPNV